MYDRLGDLLSEALDKGELPKVKVFTYHGETPPQKAESESPPESTKTEPLKKPLSDFSSSPKKQSEKVPPVRKKFIPESVKTALAFISIPETSSYEEAKKIYREKLLYYHPDRRADTPVLQKVAKEKTARLLKEWETVENWYKAGV